MKSKFKLALGAAAIAVTMQASAQVTFFERPGFEGRSFTADKQIGNFERFGFNDRASSVVVKRGVWEACENARFEGQCVILRPGSYGSLNALGLNNSVSSVRPVNSPEYGNGREFYSPSGYDYRKRKNERTYEAQVTSVRAIVGPPQQRCWVEQQQVVTSSPDVNIPGAIIGGVLGGVLGHQIGGGRGQDVATGVGAVGGAVVGANVGRGSGGQQVTTQNVQRCASGPVSSRPDYWDVTYDFRGIQHRVQTTAPPGPTILVNGKGEPRV
ncbi:MAG: beta/gamma crystallin family protein [Betaproteobacteria bacterium]